MTANRTDLFKFLMGRVQYEHDYYSESWTRLDDKAQATATIAGIFMAAAFAFLQSTTISLTRSEKVLLCLIVLDIVVCIICAILSMTVQNIASPTRAASSAQMVVDILKQAPQELPERYDSLLADTIDPMIKVNYKLIDVVDKKRKRLVYGQVTLVAAAILIALLSGLVLFN